VEAVMRWGVAALLALLGVCGSAARAETTVRLAWCGPVVSTAAAPFAIAQKMGWFGEGGLAVQLIPVPGSSDCVREVATGDLPYAIPSPETVALMRLQGVKMKTFYTAYQSNIYGLAVPADSPIQTVADLKGKTIGVTAMSSAGVVIVRALAADAGLNPASDIRIVVSGEGGQTAALLRNHQFDALSQFDAAYALVENAGIKLRMLDTAPIAKFPANGLVALEKTLTEHRAEAVALARGLAMGTVFMQANPQAAVAIMFALYPQTKPIGKPDAEALADGLRPLQARLHAWDLASSGATKYGENIVANYDGYLNFLTKHGALPPGVSGADVVTNDLIDDANRFDANAVRKQAMTYGH
jgi:NitT/TauT family transport system substrate-binding protein